MSLFNRRFAAFKPHWDFAGVTKHESRYLEKKLILTTVQMITIEFCFASDFNFCFWETTRAKPAAEVTGCRQMSAEDSCWNLD